MKKGKYGNNNTTESEGRRVAVGESGRLWSNAEMIPHGSSIQTIDSEKAAEKRLKGR